MLPTPEFLLFTTIVIRSTAAPIEFLLIFTTMQSSKRLFIYHITGCLAFLALPVFLFPHPPEEVGFLFSKPTQRDFIANALMLAFFYGNYYLLIPRIYFRRQFALYAFCIVACFLTIVLLPSIVTGHNPLQPPKVVYDIPKNSEHFIPPPPKGTSFLLEVKHHIFLFVAVILFSILLRIRQRLFRAQEDKLNAELSSLKAQINPHFLFNTLNSIYALAVKKDDKTADAVVNLSELMRYIIREAHNNKVALEKELNYISNYIDLQRSRLGNTARIFFTATGNPEGKEIAPLILITFIENAFKYGINPDEDSEIRIQIDVDKSDLHLQIHNKKVKTSKNSNSTGIGIENTRERLQLLYPAKHSLIIKDNNINFSVNLTMTLT